MSAPRKLYAIDCETDPFKAGRVPEPFLWDAFDGTTHFTYERVSDLKHFLEGHRCVAYAHNGGRFDFLMPDMLKGIEVGSDVKLINGRLGQFRIGECEYRDSMLIYPESLSSFQKLEIDYSKLERNRRRHHMEEIIKYLHVDTESLFKLVKYFLDTYGNSLTIAGAAMKFWSTQANIEPPRSNSTFFHEHKEYYYGGRVQVWKGGIINEPFVACDINSAYPFAMLEKHPYSTTFDEVENVDIRAPIIPQSLYHCRARSNGCLPYREAGAITFPADNNTREFYCTGWELAAGLDTGSVDLSCIMVRKDFHKLIDFKKYVGHFYRLKNEAAESEGKKSAAYLFAKRMMNALSGKFGAHPDEYLKYILTESKYAYFLTRCQFCRGDGCVACDHTGQSDRYTAHGQVGGFAIIGEQLDEMEKRFYNIATIASITGHTRAYLWRHAIGVLRAGRDLIYCDTDCLVFTGETPLSHFKLGKELGQWSADKAYDRGGIGGKKLYAFHERGGSGEDAWKTACKGARLTAKQIMAVAGGREVVYKPDAPTMRVGNEPKFINRRIRQTGTVAKMDKRR